jgi:hypothetical protein
MTARSTDFHSRCRRVLPAWDGPALWVLIALLGLGAVLVATLLEQGRAAAGRTVNRIKGTTFGWE